jgi:hypothetical protein
MKKLLLSCVLGLASLGLWSSTASAWTFGLIVHHDGCCGHGCGHCCSGAYFCVKQYNAFSPVACGSLCLDGCSPFGAPSGDCGGCCPSVSFSGTPCCSAAPAPPGLMPAMPYPGPLQAAGYEASLYGHGQPMPASVLPTVGQPNGNVAAAGR